MAELILDSVVRDDRRLCEFVNLSTADGTTMYAPKVVAERRRDFGRLLGPALAAANEYLKQHMAPPYRFAARDVVGWMRLLWSCIPTATPGRPKRRPRS